MERGEPMSAPSTKVGQNWEEEEAEKSTAASKVKAEAGRGGTHIEIKVLNPTPTAEESLFFRIRRDVKMGRLMDMYCEQHSIRSRYDISFIAEGARIHPDKTPDEIGLEDGDVIYVIPAQTGS